MDLPNRTERETIWRIQIARHGRNPELFDAVRLAELSEGWTGAEIEQAFIDALYAGFAAGNEPTDLTISMVMENLAPLSKLMNDQITALRKWSKGRARPATTGQTDKTERKIMVA